jgi:hypothetical protein
LLLDSVGNVSSNVCNDDDDDDDDGDDNNGGSEESVGFIDNVVCERSSTVVEDKVTKGDILKFPSRGVVTDSFNHSTSRVI